MKWWQTHGDKVTAWLTGLFLILEKLSPQSLTQLLGPDGPQWVTIAGVVYTAVHNTFIPDAAAAKPPNNPAGPATSKFVAFIMLTAGAAVTGHILQGCVTNAAQTFEQSMLAASTLNNTVVQSVDSLAKQNAISRATGESIITITGQVQAALNLANAAYTAGNQATATAKLAAAAGAIAQVQACLTVPSTLVTCLQGVSTP